MGSRLLRLTGSTAVGGGDDGLFDPHTVDRHRAAQVQGQFDWLLRRRCLGRCRLTNTITGGTTAAGAGRCNDVQGRRAVAAPGTVAAVVAPMERGDLVLQRQLGDRCRDIGSLLLQFAFFGRFRHDDEDLMLLLCVCVCVCVCARFSQPNQSDTEMRFTISCLTEAQISELLNFARSTLQFSFSFSFTLQYCDKAHVP